MRSRFSAIVPSNILAKPNNAGLLSVLWADTTAHHLNHHWANEGGVLRDKAKCRCWRIHEKEERLDKLLEGTANVS